MIALDAEGRILLQEFRRDDGTTMWITPGGGLDPDESYEEAAVRELSEEVGHDGAELGPCVWTRTHEFTFRGTPYRQHERFFVARTGAFEPVHDGWEPVEHEIIVGHKWWSLDEIRASTALFAPRRIAELLVPLLEGNPPDSPIDAGP